MEFDDFCENDFWNSSARPRPFLIGVAGGTASGKVSYIHNKANEYLEIKKYFQKNLNRIYSIICLSVTD